MKNLLLGPPGTIYPRGFRLNVKLVNLIFILLLFACKKDLVQDQFQNEQLQSESLKKGLNRFAKPDFVVHKGQSIQAVINTAPSGSLIQIEPGTYSEAIVITLPGIKLVGLGHSPKEGVILQNPGAEENGITVMKGADRFSVENLTVQNFTENGIFLSGVNGFTISNVHAVNNGEYGIFPVLSSHGIIELCTASGHADTGIYVGQSSDVVIRFNEVFDNVNGIESENAHNILITLNNAHDNSLGIFADLLPGLTVTTSSNIQIIANVVKNNNHPNFSDPNDLAAAVPSGVGILVLGADQTLVERNLVSGNNFTGITVFSTLVLGALAGLPPEAFAGIDPNPDGAIVRRNILSNNGQLPPVLPIPVPGVDLLWDGSGNNNCWSNNIFKTSYPSPLPSCN